ncbi:chemotaxis protein, partial [Burkholderia sp. Ac-20392]|nr:chemotaxis protein [Burkholderia sp. Ac-20392]
MMVQAWMIQMAAALAGGVVVAIVAAVVFRVTRKRLVAALERDTAQ